MTVPRAGERAHRRRRLRGRDPGEAHRTTTPLELLYDLTIVVAIGTAANELHILLLAATAAVLLAAVLLATAGVSMAVCLVVLMFAPVVTVIGFELVGHRHMEAVLARVDTERASAG